MDNTTREAKKLYVHEKTINPSDNLFGIKDYKKICDVMNIWPGDTQEIKQVRSVRIIVLFDAEEEKVD